MRVLIDDKTGLILIVGDMIETFRGEVAEIVHIHPTRNIVTIEMLTGDDAGQEAEYFPSVVHASFKEQE